MSIVVTSKSFIDQFTEDTGEGVSYLNGTIADRLTATIDFYVKWSLESKRIKFAASGKTIELLNLLDQKTFETEGFKVGDTIEVEDTASNDGTYTIDEIVDVRKIKTIESLVDETAEEGSIFGTTPVTDLDFFYNLIENSSVEMYLSAIDKGTVQKFIFTGLDASDEVTVVDSIVGSKSFAWVTNSLLDAEIGSTDQVTIIGKGISADHKQQFELVQVFDVTPFFLRNQVDNFLNDTTPDYFSDGKALRYILRLDAKYSQGTAEVGQTGGDILTKGSTSWFDRHFNGGRPDYFIENTVFSIGGLSADTISLNEPTDVTITLKSRAGKFNNAASPSKFVAGHFHAPLVESRYINTSTVHFKNFLYDRKFVTIDSAAVDGDNFGTDYQVLTDIVATFVDANTAIVTFTVDYSALILDYLKGIDSPYVAFFITTQDPLILTTKGTDRVATLTDLFVPLEDKDDSTLVELVDFIRCFHYPDRGVEERNSVGGYQGDPVYLDIPFRVETAEVDGVIPKILRAGVRMIAVKTDKVDFVLEEKFFDVSKKRFFEGIQDISIQESRGFLANDLYDEVSFKRVKVLDSGTMAGFLFRYAFVLRYEEWLSVLPLDEVEGVDVFKDIENPTHEWGNFDENGWSLKMEFFTDVEGYDGHKNEFFARTSVKVKKQDEEPDEAPLFEVDVKYFDIDDNEIGGILRNDITKVEATFTGNFEVIPAGFLGFHGELFADLKNEGSIFNRRFASSEIPSEDSSPWSAVDDPGDADVTRANGNARISIYNFSRITVSGFYDDRFQEWGSRVGEILIYARVGLKHTKTDCLILGEDGKPVLLEDGTAMLLENCP